MWKNRTFCFAMFCKNTEFSTRAIPNATTSTSEKYSRGPTTIGRETRLLRDEPRENKRTKTLREIRRILNVEGRLRSIEWTRPETGRYKLIIDSGAAINLMKRKVLTDKEKLFKFSKNFQMRNDHYQSIEAVYLNFFKKKQTFHIVEDDFPIPKDGIIGIKFFKKYERYAITPKVLIVENKKLPLIDDGTYIPSKTSKICNIDIKMNDKDV